MHWWFSEALTESLYSYAMRKSIMHSTRDGPVDWSLFLHSNCSPFGTIWNKAALDLIRPRTVGSSWWSLRHVVDDMIVRVLFDDWTEGGFSVRQLETQSSVRNSSFDAILFTTFLHNSKLPHNTETKILWANHSFVSLVFFTTTRRLIVRL